MAMRRVARGKWFDEFVVGETIAHAVTRTVTETDNVLFTTMTMNPAPVHLDAAYMADSEFGRPLVNSLFTMGLVVGLSVHETTHGTIIANLGFSDAKFPSPVFAGDTLWVETEVIDARESKSRPTAGVITLEHRAFNQRDELVCRMSRQVLVNKKPRP
jgi:acyl dehydratase